jgi:hypothetical protein
MNTVVAGVVTGLAISVGLLLLMLHFTPEEDDWR